MATSLKTNPVIMIAVGAVGLLILFSLVRCEGPNKPTGLNNTQTDKSAEGDTIAESIDSFSAEVDNIKNKFTAFIDEEEKRGGRIDKMDRAMQSIVKSLDTKSREVSTSLDPDLQKLRQEISNLKTQMVTMKQAPQYSVNSRGSRDKGSNTTNGMIQILPVSQSGSDAFGDVVNALNSSGLPVGSPLTGGSKPNIIPAYTIPANASLMGSVTMTPLVGRIPINQSIRDPMPFKVIVGSENLAANGLEMPDLEGIIISGYAIGDRTLSCVTGRIQSMTFVFADGRISTTGSMATGSSSTASGSGLGWISDEHGFCLPGKIISNARQYLTGVAALGIAAGAADAAAAAQTTTTYSGSTGTGSSLVTGDSGAFIAGSAVSSGLRDITQYLSDRLGETFDAVVTQPGISVVLNIDKEILIDYDPNGRKLNYVTDTISQQTPYLD